MPSAFIGKVGQDAFGDYLVETIKNAGVDVNYIFRTKQANTKLAFVSLMCDGERDFSFYRNPGADMLLDEIEIDPDWFSDGDYLHFGTVDLIEAPVKRAHIKAIESVKEKEGTIIFDPNLRFALWEDVAALKDTVWDFMTCADILKISDNELKFIFGTANVEKAAQLAFKQGVKVFLYTMGKAGSRLLTPEVDVFKSGFSVEAVDTTGAGDAFVGALAAKLIKDSIALDALTPSMVEGLLNTANACGAIVASRYGAIESMPSADEIEAFIDAR